MRRILVATLGALAVGAACSSSSSEPSGTPDQPGALQVFMQGSAFNPATRTVAVGATVTWTNKDGVSHTVTSAAIPAGVNPFGSGSLGANGTYSLAFNQAGSYGYYCTIHGTPNSGMRGTVIVQ